MMTSQDPHSYVTDVTESDEPRSEFDRYTLRTQTVIDDAHKLRSSTF